MCVLAFAHRVNPRWPLVLAGNRDERHDRPAAPLGRWDEAPHILAGRDLTAGGLWLGVSERGPRLVTVTNVRSGGGPPPTRPSRGWLARDVLMGAEPTEALADYGPFNLVVIDGEALSLWSNRADVERRALTPGLYGLANGALDEDAARVTALKAATARWLDAGEDSLDPLFSALGDDRPFAADDAYNGAPVFLHHPVYGTRCSTIVRVDADGAGEMVERRFDAAGEPTGETAVSFAWAQRQA